MKKKLTIAVVAVLGIGLASYAAAHMGQGRGSWRGEGGYWDRHHYEEPSAGMHGRYMSREPAGAGRVENEPGDCHQSGEQASEGNAVSKGEEAAQIVASYLESTRNPNLNVGEVTEVGRDFEVEIVTKDGSLANRVLVEKSTGRILSAYR